MNEHHRYKAMMWLLAGLGAAAMIAAMVYDAKPDLLMSDDAYSTLNTPSEERR